ncbi:AAA family ATPase [Mariniblastus sp.]|nr:AAA family ATPase [Mariniblastus sp.]
MIKSLRLINFKGFDRHTVEFQPFSVVVGHNNAGKSSAFEALRIVATVAKKLLTHKFVDSPDWAYGCGMGISPKLDEINLKRETIFYKYSEPPATIKATFENGAQIFVHLGPDEKIHAQAITPDGRHVKTKTLARNCEFPPIFILPQISPLLETETALRKSYVQKCIDTQLSSRHFRNQIRYMYEHFDDFRNLFQQTWDSISIAEFDDPNAYYEDELFLMLREEGFVAEVSNFGHGLQMWLQIAWFLARTDCQSIVILDEPDVYMHPQQQQRMIELLRGRFRQCILSTHAPGILDHCHEEEILRLHRKLEKSSCELDSNTYEELLLEEHKTPLIIEKNTETSKIEMKVVVYPSGSLKIKNSADKCILDIKAKTAPNQPPEFTDEDEESMEDPEERRSLSIAEDKLLSFEVRNTDDVNLYFDGVSLVIEDYELTDTQKIQFQITPREAKNNKIPIITILD